ncbi:MAG TPA: hypothetical protein PKO33_00065 [Pyrinomonadaceae bacterium]|nr:hypothetical protein [Pyrinomonadaceae bacterium]
MMSKLAQMIQRRMVCSVVGHDWATRTEFVYRSWTRTLWTVFQYRCRRCGGLSRDRPPLAYEGMRIVWTDTGGTGEKRA